MTGVGAGMGKRGDNPRETPAAAQAFADYVGMGAGRSLRDLHDRYRRQTASKPPARRLETLFDWSVKYGWQDRLAASISARSEAVLFEAAEIDADSFLETSRLIRKRLNYTDPGHIDVVVKIRESVRKPAAKGAVAVNVTVMLQQLAAEAAGEAGLDVAEVMAETERILARVGS